ncbi:MAG: Unknown protein [uncultured Aureispira sp.]|uniref:Uncharacterized protein n=1 Tax=uncultured Aureispira sp. TaxID=1331704 RepID=A0A6S6SQR0_9BACT|nr:MAG: Unknown protein [uncultured Aureispira sp.]
MSNLLYNSLQNPHLKDIVHDLQKAASELEIDFLVSEHLHVMFGIFQIMNKQGELKMLTLGFTFQVQKHILN